MPDTAFSNRIDAGAQLADLINRDKTIKRDSLVLGLVRGGAVISSEIARCIELPWDVFIVRKIGAPKTPEYAVGAVSEEGTYIFNFDALEHFGLTRDWQNEAISAALQSCKELQEYLRKGRQLGSLSGRDVVICDDGMATGLTMQVAIASIRQQNVNSVSVAVPVLSREALHMLENLAVQTFYISCPMEFHAVGNLYDDFSPVDSHVVAQLLAAREA